MQWIKGLVLGLLGPVWLYMSPGLAQESVQAEPPLFDDAPSSTVEEPAIVITEEQNLVVKEYRIKGQLYMIEIQPSKGKPYYLLDTDGDGRMESRRSELERGFRAPSWVLLRW